ncbi:hypothetical protein [Spirosoma endophyticum]|uniref:Uncharacterized protein n=1 Tax=Spirosoma endophyticum TaxID=662367 RepID=A0A1I2GIL2_9BACT|nr:hypothetical protein [Spirosoma endophyticum]SFF16576.1 hypothetical protein SAMN05216167_13226 [Spirosoma endophyticum]
MDYPIPLLLRYPYYLDPHVLNSLKGGLAVLISESNKLVIQGSVFTSDNPLPVGEEGTIWPSRFHAELYLKKDLQEFQVWQKEQNRLKEQQQTQLRIQKAQARQEASDEFYRRHPIPFAFSIKIKEALSGLSASSWGDGQKRNTVYHIYTQEEVRLGRLYRPKGEFLCSPVKSRSGANWSDSLGKDSHRLDADGIKQVPTCKRCLDILKRFSKTSV